MYTLRLLSLLLFLPVEINFAGETPSPHWEWCGWGGGGYMWTADYHPTRPGLIYMGGDCAGCYKSEDDGQHWRMINHGLADYTIYGMAVAPRTPDTVYTLAEFTGLCKSTDAGEHWQYFPETAKGKLNIYSQRHISVRPLAVSPENSDVVYAATPLGKIFRSEDGGQTWKEVFQIPPGAVESAREDVLRAEFAASGPFGAFFIPLTPPDKTEPQSFGISLKSDGNTPKEVYVSLQCENNAVYRSKNLASLLGKSEWQEVVLGPDAFSISSYHAGKDKAKAQTWPLKPDFKSVSRMDFTCSGVLRNTTILFRSIYFSTDESTKVVLRDFSENKKCQPYGSIRTLPNTEAKPPQNTFSSISIASKNPQLVIAASPQRGLFLSSNGGNSWEALQAPASARFATFDPQEPKTIYGAFGKEGVHKSVDGGKTWLPINNGIRKECAILQVAISPSDSQDLVCIGSVNWDGSVYWSENGGETWKSSAKLQPDFLANPTGGTTGFSRPTNITYSPTDPDKLYLSANWRPAFSNDGGRTWTERDRGADISCVYDIRFSKTRVYAACMDEGVLFSEDNGQQWRQAWPKGPESSQISGHYWRLHVSDNHGTDRIVSSCSPWNANDPNKIVVSEDGAATFKVVSGSGLIDYRPKTNTMWGQSFARAMAPDPNEPNTIYLGMDGDAEAGKAGGGIFRSTDGGYTWKQLEHQPGSRRMFFGLAVDPTDSKRLYWGACDKGGGVYRSEDGGESWKYVFKEETWIFNLLVTADGTLYAPGKNLWKSSDHGETWQKLTDHPEGQILGLEVSPTDPGTIWYSRVKWGGVAWGYIMKSTDGGVNWQDITGDIGYRKPAVLRYNPVQQELWAGGVGLFKLKQPAR